MIYDGFPASEFAEVPASREAAFRNRFALGNAQLVGLVGRIKMGRKGQDVFVRAAHLLRDRFPDARFLIMGSPFPGNEKHLDLVQQLVRELDLSDRVVYTGDVEDIKGAMSALDVSTLASATPEPFGGVVVESMALGKPVVGTKLGGTAEQIVDEETGFLVEPNDPDAMARATGALLADPAMRSRMGENGRRRFMERFEFEKFYEKIMAVFEGLRS